MSPRASKFYRRSAIVAIAAALLTSVGAVIAQTLSFGPLERPKASGPCAVDVSDLSLPGGPAGRDIAVRVWAPSINCQLPGESQPGRTRPKSPLVLYAPGLGGARSDGSTQAQELASHGYAVAGIDDVSSPDTLVNFDISTDAAVARMFEQGGRHALAQSRLLEAVLAGLPASLPSALAGQIDFGRVGVLGYSIGGAAGAILAGSDNRVGAFVNMDGWMFGDMLLEMPTRPYLMLWSDESFPPERDRTSADASRRNEFLINADQNTRNFELLKRPQTFWVHLRGSVHGDFSEALYRPESLRNRRPAAQRREIGAGINAYLLAFFDLSLKGIANPLLTEQRSIYPSARMMTSADRADLSATAPTKPGAGEN